MSKQYFYKDKNDNIKKYVGKVKKHDGKLLGELVEANTETKMVELNIVEDHVAVEGQTTYLVWKDKFGTEHELTDNDNVSNNKVIDKREYQIPIKYHPEIKESYKFVDNQNREYNGEVIEKDGKFFAKL